ncbi:hypothetical protein [Ornithinimicrobium sediminis]|uniref:hypothetical protein n=1 Tax=Ornithinimicrobium sediminis TaxID=2904603 RepID=UPI001E3A423C|nr:hypothetical protein [Ornithinimicrobium sediminis]MCE0488434.1 hypothetical protein [Ornithinimicrobium sediminis]
MLIRRAGTAAVLTTATTVLAACASIGGFSDLDRDPQPNDPLPEVAVFEGVEIVANSSRSVGTHEGVELWLVRTAADGVCLLVYPDEEDWAAGCSDRGPVNVGGPAGSFTVVPDGEEPPESATRVSENVFAR